jgi:superfamily I DNA/RNA helicase
MALKKMNYSSYQLNIFKEIENGSGNLAINAVAGSGKTTTIVSACKRLRKNEHDVKFLAFNKLIADELKEKLDGYAEVSTLHAFGFSILKKIYNKPSSRRYINVDSWRYQKYVKNNVYSLSSIVTLDTSAAKIFGFCCNVSKLMDLARVNLIKHGEVSKLRNLCDEHNLVTLFDEVEVCDILLEDAYTMPKNLTIDFVDMVVLPLFHKEYIPSYKYVFIDECQDLNTAQRELMLCAAKGGRFIAVGDRNQAINGFAGADCNSFDKIANIPNTKELPLSVNYRCGFNMVNLAKELVPQIEAHEGAICGEIDHVNKLTRSLFQPNDMILCRTSAPLVGLCMKLIENGISAVVKGKDIAQGLLNLIENANTDNIDNLLKYLNNEKQKMIAVIKSERKCSDSDAMESARYRNLDDRCKCIENICLYHLKDTKQLKMYVSVLFTDERINNAITLSTAHKSKGLESNRVLILLPDKMPLKWPQQKQWQLQQEQNLKYVAITRARKELVFVDLTEQQLLQAQIEND